LELALLPYLRIESLAAITDVGGATPEEFTETAVRATWATRILLLAALAE
jgi:hypothetical protein